LLQIKPTHELLWSFHTFPKNPNSGALVLGPDGYYWGATSEGGSQDLGTVFKVKADGSDWKLVHFFTEGSTNSGFVPIGGLVNDGLGSLWGTTAYGGTFGYGTIFRIYASTGELTNVVNFRGTGDKDRGAYPISSLIDGGDGFLWGTTAQGGVSSGGTVFKVNARTGLLTTVAEMATTSAGSYPEAGLVAEGDFFWGTTGRGGNAGFGTVYKVNRITGAVTLVADLLSGYENTGLVADGLGFMWGATPSSVFKVNIGTGELTPVVTTPEYRRYSSLINDGAGSLWGTVAYGSADQYGSIYKIDLATGELITIRAFSINLAFETGAYPAAPLTMVGPGIFIGTNQSYGPTDGGTVFKVDGSTGDLSVLTAFIDDHSERKGTFPYAVWRAMELGTCGNNTAWGSGQRYDL
jgi:uncharacterized repeat protein (TIGR03803 family)